VPFIVNIVKIIKSRNIRWAGHAEHTGYEKCMESLIGKTGGERPLGRTKGGWDSDI
jgi:hypothetical protein